MRLLLITIACLWPLPAAAQVVISEVHWVGTDYSTADEWLELTALETVNVAGWRVVRVNDGEEKTMLTLPDGAFVAAGEMYVISNYDGSKTRLSEAPDLASTKVSLVNSQLKLRLYNASGTLIDAVDDGSGAPFAGGKTDDGLYAGMERRDLHAPGTTAGNWRTATTAVGLEPDSPVLGTPGFPNGYDEEVPSSSSSSKVASSFPSSGTGKTAPHLRISEVLANPDGKDDTEWIELMNAGEEPVPLEGLRLAVGSRDFVFPAGGPVLLPDEYIFLQKTYTNLPLRNRGNTVQLWQGDALVDELEYGETGEEVSYGRWNNSILPLCIPTPGKENKKIDQLIHIDVQSGKTKGVGETKVNVQADVFNGTMETVECYWEYSDGYRSTSCNPPSHTFDTVGQFSIELRADNMCGDSVVEVLRGIVHASSSSSSSSLAASSIAASEAMVKASGVGTSSSISSIPSISSNNTSSLHTPHHIILSEVYPAPNTGEDEWIELFNPSLQPVNIAGWQLDDVADGGSAPWTIPPSQGEIPAAGYRVFYHDNTGVTLNNAGDDVRLLQPDGTVSDAFSYDRVAKGRSVVRRNTCESRTPTPGEKNVCINNSDSKVSGVQATRTKTAYTAFVREKYENVVTDNSSSSAGKSSSKASPLLARLEPYSFPRSNATPTPPPQQPKPTVAPDVLFLVLLTAVGGGALWWHYRRQAR